MILYPLFVSSFFEAFPFLPTICFGTLTLDPEVSVFPPFLLRNRPAAPFFSSILSRGCFCQILFWFSLLCPSPYFGGELREVPIGGVTVFFCSSPYVIFFHSRETVCACVLFSAESPIDDRFVIPGTPPQRGVMFLLLFFMLCAYFRLLFLAPLLSPLRPNLALTDLNFYVVFRTFPS